MSSTTSTEIQEYRLSLSAKILAISLSLILLCIVVYFALTAPGSKPGPYAWLVLLPVGVLAILVLATLRRKLTITNQDIIYRGTFGTRTLPINAVKGSRVLSRGAIIIEPTDKGRKSIQINSSDDFINGDQLQAWLLASYKDLNATDKRAAARQVLSNSVYGTSTALRKRRFRLATTITCGYNVWGTLAAAVIFMFSIPASNLVMLLPLAGIALMVLSRGLIRFYCDSWRSIYPGCGFGIALTGSMLLLRSVNDYTLVEATPIWLPALVLAVIILLLLYKKGLSPSAGFPKIQVVMMCCTAMICSAGLLLHINGQFDRSAATTYPAEVQERYTRTRKGRQQYYFVLAPWADGTRSSTTGVSGRRYEEKQVGDTVSIMVHQGLLGMPWYQLYP